jgi:hypothetical protein
MIDLLNRIGFKQIAFGGGGGGGGGGGNNDNDDYGYDPYEDADLYDDNGYQTEYSDPNYGYDDNDNDNNDYYYDEPLTPIAPPSTPAPDRLMSLPAMILAVGMIMTQRLRRMSQTYMTFIIQIL